MIGKPVKGIHYLISNQAMFIIAQATQGLVNSKTHSLYSIFVCLLLHPILGNSGITLFS